MVRKPALAIIAAIPMGGCSGGAPTIFLAGAYFPAWLLCAVAGILGAVLVRVILVLLGIDDAIPFRLVTYVAVAIAIGLMVSVLGFGR
jgi:hypothetical protein